VDVVEVAGVEVCLDGVCLGSTLIAEEVIPLAAALFCLAFCLAASRARSAPDMSTLMPGMVTS
jgi:hypothetical protein